jgi:hypothetical protein
MQQVAEDHTHRCLLLWLTAARLHFTDAVNGDTVRYFTVYGMQQPWRVLSGCQSTELTLDRGKNLMVDVSCEIRRMGGLEGRRALGFDNIPNRPTYPLYVTPY